MSTTQASAFAAALQARLAPFGVEGAAAAWMAKALHPAGVGSAPLMPDQTYVEAVRPEYRSQAIISAPVGLVTPSWDLAIVRVPGDDAPVFWSAGNSGIDFATTPALAKGQISLSDWDYATTDGVLTNVLPSSPGVSCGRLLPGDGRVSWRCSYASLTAYLTASALNDQGTVFSGQISRVPEYQTNPRFNFAQLSPAGNPLLVQGASVRLPTNEDQLLLMAAKPYTAPARDGVYIPIRLNGPEQSFVAPPFGPHGMWQTAAGSWFGGAASTYLTIPGPQDWQAVTDISTGFVENGAGGPLQRYNWGFDNTACAVTFFRGLSPAASITLKYYTGLELEVRPDSIVRQFTVVPSGYSPRALEAYYRVCQEMPNVYPSSFNSIGLLASAVMAAASKIWPMVQGVARAVVLGPVAAAAARDVMRSDLATPQVVVNPPGGRLVKLRSPSVSSRLSVGSRSSVRSRPQKAKAKPKKRGRR